MMCRTTTSLRASTIQAQEASTSSSIRLAHQKSTQWRPPRTHWCSTDSMLGPQCAALHAPVLSPGALQTANASMERKAVGRCQRAVQTNGRCRRLPSRSQKRHSARDTPLCTWARLDSCTALLRVYRMGRRRQLITAVAVAVAVAVAGAIAAACADAVAPRKLLPEEHRGQ